MKNNVLKTTLSLILALALLLPFACAEDDAAVIEAFGVVEDAGVGGEAVEPAEGVEVVYEAAEDTSASEDQQPAPEGEQPAAEAPADDGEEEAADANAATILIQNAPFDPFPSKLTLGQKETYLLNASAKLSGSITYTSSNKKVVTVNKQTGEVKAKKVGSAKITAKAGKKKVVCKITVKKAPKSVTVTPKSLTMAFDTIRKLTVKLPKKTASLLTYTSSNPAVVAVDNTGHVYGMGVGTATVTVSTFNNKTATCEVTVTEYDNPAPQVNDFVIENGVVTGYTGPGGVVAIPAADANGDPVTAIGEGAFAGNGGITGITIPSSVMEIRASAFENCGGLATVTLSNATATIGPRAFRGCAKLKTMKTYG